MGDDDAGALRQRMCRRGNSDGSLRPGPGGFDRGKAHEREGGAARAADQLILVNRTRERILGRPRIGTGKRGPAHLAVHARDARRLQTGACP